jgi:GAF domain-containing protein
MGAPAPFDSNSSRADRYDQLDMQCPAIMVDDDPVANQANFAALVHMAFGWHWVGFYRVEGEELVLGPFQGPVACTRLRKGRGVCAAAWERNVAVVVGDVQAFPGHVACSPWSKSELVLPVRDSNGVVRAVLDIDSVVHGDFDDHDAERLQGLIDGVSEALIGKTQRNPG